MPYRSWHHQCAKCRPSISSEPLCSRCGETGTPAGWRLRMHEAMGRYQYLYGLAPIGPHRALANQLFADTRAVCESCAGTGLLTLDPLQEAWTGCRECEATGGHWLISDEEVEALRRQVLARYPRAAAPGDLRFLTGVLVHDLARGVIIDGSRPEGRG